MKLSAYAQLGLRAATAVTIIWLISHGLHLNHPYWAILTVLVLVSQSWGETIVKSWKRFAMTVIGCSVGTIIVLLIGHTHWLAFVILIICAYMSIFCIPKYYANAMFFVGIGVAILFALIKQWDMHLLWVRIYETGLACIIVILTTGLFMPHFAKEDFRKAIIDVLIKMKDLFHNTVDSTPSAARHFNEKTFNEIGQAITQLRAQFVQVRYELFFMPQRRRRIGSILQHLEISTHYLTNLLQIIPQLDHTNQDYKQLWQCIGKRIVLRFDEIHQLFRHEEIVLAPPLQAIVDPILINILSKQPRHFNDDHQTHLAAVLYYGQQLDDQLLTIANSLS